MHRYLTGFFFFVSLLPFYQQNSFAGERFADSGFENARLSVSGGLGIWHPNGEVTRVRICRGKGVSHTGATCIELNSSAGGEAMVYQPLGAVKSGERYTFTVWAKGQGNLMLQVYQYDSSGKGIPTVTDVWKSVSNQWQQFTWEYRVPEKVTTIAAAIHTKGGIAYLDDASFRPCGEEPGEESVSLTTFTTHGCTAERGRIHLPVTYLQGDASNLFMEAEQALSLRFYGAGSAVDRPGSVGSAISFLNGFTFLFELKRPGTYRTWYRVWTPFNACWGHNECMDGGKEMNNQEDTTQPGARPEHPAQTWYWVSGPSYTLKAGKHRWEFLNWHGGICLDRVLLTSEPTFTPEGEGGPTAECASAQPAEAVSQEVKPLSVKAWKKLVMIPKPGGGILRTSFSEDSGKTWHPLGADGNLAGIPVRGDGSDRLKFRFELIPGSTAELPEIRDLSVHYLMGDRDEITIENSKFRLTLRGSESALVGLYNKEKQVYYSSTHGGSPLFVLGIHRTQPDGQKRFDEIPSTAGALQNADLVPTRKGSEFRFCYLMEEGQVKVKGWLRADETEVLRGQIGIENNSTNEVIAVSFPLLKGLAIGGKAEEDFLALPYVQGRFIKNPSSENFSYPRYFTWPGGLSMNWVDLFNPGIGVGLYFSCYDSSAGTTEFLPRPSVDKSSLDLGLRKWFRAKPGEKWESPEVILGMHNGDWHWGADQYSKWAHTWMRPTKPSRWFRESEGFHEGFPLHTGDFVDQPFVASNGQPTNNLWYLAWAQMCDADGCCGLFPYPCPLLGSKEEFRWSNDRIHERGNFSGYYIGASLWNPAYTRDAKVIGNTPVAFLPPDERQELKDPGFFKRVRVVEPDGQASPEEIGDSQIDAASKEWRDHLVHWTLRYLKEFNADGIYFDHLGIQVAWPSVNYTGHTSPDEWGRSQMAMLKEIKQRGRAINPDTLFAMEGCADVYFQDADMGLLSGSNGMELFRYTFPETIHTGGASSGTTLQNTLRNVFILGYKMEGPWFTDPRMAKQEPWGPKVVALRQRINPFLFRATFRDTIGILKCGEDSPQYDGYSDKIKLDARLFIRNEPGNRGALLTLNNRVQVEGQQVTVDTTAWGPVRIAWRVSPEGFHVLTGRQEANTFTFVAPVDFYSAVLLINESEPLVTVRDVPRVGAAGASVKGPVVIRNVEDKPVRGFIEMRVPEDYRSQRIAFGPLEPGQQIEREITFTIGSKAPLGRKDLECLVTGSKGLTAWTVPFRVIRPLVATLGRLKKDQLELVLENHGPAPLTGKVMLTATGSVKLEPAVQTCTVAAKETMRLQIHCPQLPVLSTRELARATITYPGGESVALRSLRPGFLNGGFEDDSTGEGLPDWFHHYEMRILSQRSIGKFDDQVFYKGKRSWRLDPGDHLYTWLVRGRPHTKYRFSCAIRRVEQDRNIGLHLTPAADPWPGIAIGHTDKARLNEWEIYHMTFTSGDAGRTVFVQLLGSNKGPVWFDELKLEEVD